MHTWEMASRIYKTPNEYKYDHVKRDMAHLQLKPQGGKCVGQHLWSFLDLEFIEENLRLTETSNSSMTV